MSKDTKIEKNEKEEKKCMNDKCTCDDKCECDDKCTCDENCECNDACHCVDKEDTFSSDDENKKIEELEKKLKEAEEKVLRTQAEMINFRKRKEEETARMLKYSNEDMIKELLPIIDNFERAINMDDDNLEDEVSKFLKGFKMIYCNLNSVLEKEEVKEIEALNKEFDANVHHAVMKEKVKDVESNVVIEVLQKGYMYKDKVIRPAMVKVSE